MECANRDRVAVPRAVPCHSPTAAAVPRLDDDGLTVTLDLHGARVDEALGLARDVVAAAAEAGRRTVRLIHGHSTTGSGARTIKSALRDEIDRGAFDAHVASELFSDGHVLLGLATSPRLAPARLRLADFW